MSTLKVDTLQNISGNKETTIDEKFGGIMTRQHHQ